MSLCGCESEEKYPNPTDKFFVNDFAGVIDDTAEAEFYSKAAALDKATTAQVVIVTVESLGGEEPADYALELGRRWGVGNKETDNGVVILLSRDDREIYIAVGYGLEGALPDSKTGRIIDIYGLEYLKKDDFSKGLIAIGEAIINEVYIEYDLQPEQGYVPVDNLPDTEDVDLAQVGISWIVLIIIIIVIAGLSRRFGGFWFFFGPTGRGGFGGGGFHSGRGGGGFGGFSGGGGSFGGGGAGRSF